MVPLPVAVPALLLPSQAAYPQFGTGLQATVSGGRVNAMHSPNSPQIQMKCINLLHATARGSAQHTRPEQGMAGQSTADN